MHRAVRVHGCRRGRGGDKWGRLNPSRWKRRVFILVVARQVIRPPQHPQPLLIHLHKPILHDGCLPMENVLWWWYFNTPLLAYAGMQNALRPSSSSRASLFCSIYETVLFIFPPAACSLTPACLHSCSLHHSVLWLQIYSDSSTEIQCTLPAFAVATGVWLQVCVSVYGCVFVKLSGCV